MVIADFNIICLSQKKAEFYKNNEINCEFEDLNSTKKISYYKDNWYIFKGLKGIWYDIFPIDRSKNDYQYDKEFFDLYYIKNNSGDVIDALKNKNAYISCIENSKESIVKLIEFYLDKSPIKRICFMCRVQDEEVETILGTLSKKEFLSKLQKGQLKYNIAYIVSKD